MTTAQDQQSRELLPCPFCGGAPETTGPWEIGVSDNYETCICCEKCGFHISSDDGFASGEKQSLAKAIDRWNRRAPAEQAARALPASMKPVAEIFAGDLFRVSQGPDAEPVTGNHDLYTAAQVLAMGRVPPEWQAVPVDRTEEMKRAAMELLLDGLDIYVNGQDQIVIETDAPRRIWKAMLAASPRPPAAQEPPSASNADGGRESIRRALHWIDADLRETMRDYLRRMASDDEFHKSVDQLEHILRQGLGKAEPTP